MCLLHTAIQLKVLGRDRWEDDCFQHLISISVLQLAVASDLLYSWPHRGGVVGQPRGSLIANGRSRRGASSEEQNHSGARTGRHFARDSQKRESYCTVGV